MRTGRHSFLSTLAGPQDLGSGPAFWSVFAVAALALLAFPLVGSRFHLSNLANFFVYVPMGLGLGLLWGYGGILSFGQGAFFGIAGQMAEAINRRMDQRLPIPEVRSQSNKCRMNHV